MDANTTQQHGAKEITENSLLNLLVQELFAQQQDSEEVRNIIQGSEKLQKYMFLVLPHTPPERWTVIKRNGRYAFKLVVDDSEVNPDTPLIMPVTLNPMLEVETSRPNGVVRVKCIQRTYWSKRWHNEHVRMVAQNQAIDRNASLLASYISDPPCREVVVSFDFRVDCPRSTTRPELHPHSGSVKNVTVTSQTGLTLGMLLEGALDAPGEFRGKDQYGTIRSQGVTNLRYQLELLDNPRILVDMPWEFELVYVLGPQVKVVVPTTEEWAEVRERGARGK
jgi:hypothetical protein